MLAQSMPISYHTEATAGVFLYILSFRHSSKNYGLVMTGQAAAAPVIAIITEFLSPAIGRSIS